jgi:hypothetical protein
MKRKFEMLHGRLEIQKDYDHHIKEMQKAINLLVKIDTSHI